jgi:hypothetical protein
MLLTSAQDNRVGPGRPPVPLALFSLAPIAKAELMAALESAPEPTGGVHQPTQPSLHVMRAKHHRIAMLLALGLDDSVVARATCTSVTHIRRLQDSPAFQELTAVYLDERMVQFKSVSAQFEGLTEDLVEVASGLVEQHHNGQKLSFNDVVRALRQLAPIAGYAPLKRTEHREAVLHLHPTDIETMKREFKDSNGEDVYDIRAERSPRLGGASQASPMAQVLSPDRGQDSVGKTPHGSGPALAPEAEGRPGQG